MTQHACRAVAADALTDLPECHVNAVDLACTPERLFEILADPDSWSRWAPGIRKVEWTSPRPYGVGATRTVSLLGGMQIVEHFTVWDPGREVSFYVCEANQPVWNAFAERYAVVPVGPDACRLTWTVAYDPLQGAFARMHPWIRPVMGLTLRGFLRLLRRYVAKTASAPASVAAAA
jgi:hypothetical protein